MLCNFFLHELQRFDCCYFARQEPFLFDELIVKKNKCVSAAVCL